MGHEKFQGSNDGGADVTLRQTRSHSFHDPPLGLSPPPPRAIAKETKIIKYIAEINNVDVNVDRTIRRKRIALALDQTTTHKREAPKPKWIRIPFLGRLSGKISRVLRKFDLRPAYYSVNRIQDIFPSSKDPIPILEKSGVYRLECADCPTVYIGQTGRKLKDRTAEHERAVRNHARERSNFAAHILDHGHYFSTSTDAHLLHQATRGPKLTALEEIEIHKHKRGSPLANKVIPESKLAELLYTVDVDDIY